MSCFLRRHWVCTAALLGMAASASPLAAAETQTFDSHFAFQTVVVDPAASHVHAPGENFTVNVTPFMVVGDNLASLTTVSLTPASDAAKSQNVAKAGELLFDGKEDGGSAGIMYDFFFAPKDRHTLTLHLPLSKSATVKYFSLVGFNHNGEYGISAAKADLTYTDGTKQSLSLPVIREGAKWRVVLQRTDLLPLSQLDVELSVPYKVNLTEMTLRGSQSGVLSAAYLPFKSREWMGVNLHAHWQTADGRRLTDPVALKLGESTAVVSPPTPGNGYYGLRVEADEDGMTIYQKEYGFGVMPMTEPPTQLRPDSMFGMVHWQFADKFLHTAWTKTMTCGAGYDEKTEKLDPKPWQNAINSRLKQGYLELPLLTEGWKSDATQPVSQEQVRKIQTRMEQYFRATPDVLYYELGLEENLGYRGSKYTWPFFWSNTEAKAKAVREAAQRVNPKIKLIYQIAEFDFTTLEQFCKGSVSKQFDILSMHPYAWETYPMPDIWEADMIHKVQGWMKEGGHEMPIWFTEVGAAHHGNPGGFFGYPGAKNAYDNGLTRPDYATFQTRMHVISASVGVEKLFWYNYADSAVDPFFAERHFGLVDAWGFPKPAYVAYANMVRMLEGRKFVRQENIDGISRFLFDGSKDNCWVIWTPDKAAKPSAVGANLGSIQQVIDNFGASVKVAPQKLEVGGSPLYVIVAK